MEVPVNFLPLELLIKILRLSAHPGITTAHTLSQVCQRWRVVSRSIPTLWRDITIHQQCNQSRMQAKLDVLVDLLQLSQRFSNSDVAAKLTLRVSFVMYNDMGGIEPSGPNKPSKEDRLFWKRVFEVITPYVHRWETLYCFVEDSVFVTFLKKVEAHFALTPEHGSKASPFSALKSLTVHGLASEYPLNLLFPLGLESLSIKGSCRFARKALPFSLPKIRSLDFAVTFDNSCDFVDALALSPHITDLRVVPKEEPQSWLLLLTAADVGSVTLPIALPTLKSLRLDVHRMAGHLSPYFQIFSAPNLVHLSIRSDGGYNPWKCLNHFLQRSFVENQRNGLERLSLFGPFETSVDPDYEPFFKAVSGVRALDIKVGYDEIGQDILKAVMAPQSEPDAKFPQLKVLNLKIDMPIILSHSRADRATAADTTTYVDTVIAAIRTCTHPNLALVNVTIEADHLYLRALRFRQFGKPGSSGEEFNLGVLGGEVGEGLMDKLTELEKLPGEKSGLHVKVDWTVRSLPVGPALSWTWLY